MKPPARANASFETAPKLCALVIRVSTDNQAKNPEGSLKNQLQRLRAHIEYKTNSCGENWVEAEQYVLPGISGKKSFHSKQFQQLFDDIRSGKVNTILVTALDRVCRSVKDFLAFFEILNEHKVEFVCLKQNYDTTSPQGRLFITIMMALAEFERDQTSDRNKESSLARAERGLWNGGHLLGYDLPTDGKKGTLVPNEREAFLINFAFDTYLKTGSILKTAKAMNDQGFRTKEYDSRRGKFHPARKFTWTGTMWLLTNWAYIGKKEVNKKLKGVSLARTSASQEYKLVDANWPGIVDEEKFHAVRRLLEENSRTCTNQIKGVKHCYIFNHGLLTCSKCNSEMEGRSGTSGKGTRYYYYVCKTKGCRLRVSAEDLEKVVIDRARELALRPEILNALVAETNKRLRCELPDLTEKKTTLERELDSVQAAAQGLLLKWESIGAEGDSFIGERLRDLGQRRKGLETELAALSATMTEIRSEAVDEKEVREALTRMAELWEDLPPFEKKRFASLLVYQVQVSEREVKIGFHGQPPDAKSLQETETPSTEKPRSETGVWLLR